MSVSSDFIKHKDDLMPYVIEFYGLPGGGKSTTAKALVGELKKRNLRVTNFHDIFNKIEKNPYKKVFFSLQLVLMHPYVFIKLLLSKHVFHINIKFVLYFMRIIYFHKTNFYKKNTKNADFVISDQYLLQATASFSLIGKVKETVLRELVFLAIKNVDFFVYIECDVQLSLQRVRKRNDMRSRFDYWSDELALERLTQLLCFFNAFENRSVSLKAQQDTSVNVDKLLKELDCFYE